MCSLRAYVLTTGAFGQGATHCVERCVHVARSRKHSISRSSASAWARNSVSLVITSDKHRSRSASGHLSTSFSSASAATISCMTRCHSKSLACTLDISALLGSRNGEANVRRTGRAELRIVKGAGEMPCTQRLEAACVRLGRRCGKAPRTRMPRGSSVFRSLCRPAPLALRVTAPEEAIRCRFTGGMVERRPLTDVRGGGERRVTARPIFGAWPARPASRQATAAHRHAGDAALLGRGAPPSLSSSRAIVLTYEFIVAVRAGQPPRSPEARSTGPLRRRHSVGCFPGGSARPAQTGKHASSANTVAPLGLERCESGTVVTACCVSLQSDRAGQREFFANLQRSSFCNGRRAASSLHRGRLPSPAAARRSWRRPRAPRPGAGRGSGPR